MGEKADLLLYGPRVTKALGQGVAGKVLSMVRRERVVGSPTAEAAKNVGRLAAGRPNRLRRFEPGSGMTKDRYDEARGENVIPLRDDAPDIRPTSPEEANRLSHRE